MAIAGIRTGLIASAAIYAAAAAPADAQTRAFNVPAQPALTGIPEFARQADVQILVSESATRDRQTREVRGTMSIESALRRLLRGTGLRVSSSDGRTFTLSASNVAIPVSGEARGGGEIVSGAPGGEAGRASSPAGYDVAQVSEIVVTGTRFSRDALRSPVPVDVVAADALRNAGATELTQALAAEVPSMNFAPTRSGAVFTSALRGFNYRALEPSQTLVLVNGKRWRPTSLGGSAPFFDLNSLPPTALSRVEVLRDGASAQYGSDALAGVINLILRRDVGTEMTVTAGQYYESDGETVQATLDHGIPLGEGFVHFSAYARLAQPTNRQGPDLRQQYFAGDPREATDVDRENNFPIGDVRRREIGLMLHSELPLSSDVTAYVFGNYSYRNVQATGVWRRPQENNNVRAIFPDGFNPILESRIYDFNATFGLEGLAGEWDWDASQSFGRGPIQLQSHNTVNASLGAASPTDFYRGSNVTEQATSNLDLKRGFEVGLARPLRLALGAEVRIERYKIGEGDVPSYANGNVPVLDGPNAGAVTAVGSQGSGGFRPIDAIDISRRSVAAYLDLEGQVTDALLLTGALRYENYSDFGSTLNGKLAGLLQLTPALALRASYSTGFRAPSIVESNYSLTSSAVIQGQFFISRRFPVSDPVAILLGARPLEPEKSRSLSAGATWAPAHGVSFTLDAYRTYIDDSITTTSNFNDAATRDFLTANGYPGISLATYAINGFDKRVDGIDFTGNFTRRFDSGFNMRLSAAANLNRPTIRNVAPTPPALAAITPIPLLDAAAINRALFVIPRSRITISGNFELGGFGLLLRQTRYGSIATGSGATFQRFGSEWITDIELSRQLSSSIRVAVGAQNLFDNYPDELIAATSFGGIIRYPISESPFGVSGGYYYLRAGIRF